jgi:hypothetical protein
MAHLVTTDFKLGHVNRRILVCGSLDIAEWTLVRGIVIMDVERNLDY